MLGVTETPIIFLFQSLIKKMFFVIPEAVPRKMILSIPVINVKRNNFINNGQCYGDIFTLYFLILMKT